MKLRTSYFNGTVLRKDITRFAPVWGLYTIFQLMAVLLIWEGEGSAARFASEAPYIMEAMGIVNLIYAGLCAVLLFGDLFQSRMCNALHAMPLRREGWFLTHTAAGLLFCLVPNLLGAGLAALLLGKYFYLAFIWLGMMLLQFLFFFGVGAFSALCAGNKLGTVAVYGIINFLSIIGAWLAMTFYEPFLYGIELDLERFAYFSPVYALTLCNYIDVSYSKIKGAIFEGFLQADWIYLFTAAGIGLVLLVLAMLIYRRRKLESAGDFISLRAASPVFLIIYTLCVGAVMYYVADMFSEDTRYVFLALGFAIGFFTGRMLLEKKVNVFRGRNFLAFGALIVIFLATVGLTWLDPIGITRYVPEADQVKQVTLDSSRGGTTLTEQADIEKITQIHAQQVADRHMGEYGQTLRLTYEMKTGATVERKYDIAIGSDASDTLQDYFSAFESVMGMDPETLLQSVILIEFNSYDERIPTVVMGSDITIQQNQYPEKYGETNVLTFPVNGSFQDSPLARGLVEALLADCEAGTMAQEYAYHQDQAQCGWFTIQYYRPSSTANDSKSVSSFTYEVDTNSIWYNSFEIWEDCTNTIAYLQSLQEGQQNG